LLGCATIPDQHSPTPPFRLSLQRAITVAVLAGVLFGACLVCAYGFISLFAEVDFIPEKNVGPLVGPIMSLMAGVIVVIGVVAALSSRTSIRRPQWAIAIAAGGLTYLLPAVFGAIVVAVGNADAFAGVLFFSARESGAFLATSAILATVIVLATPLVLRRAN
jgi:uncharacterized membrane protein